MWSFLKNHWKTIAVVGAASVAFVAVSVLTAGVAPALLGVAAGGSAATLLGVGAGGAASGLTGYAVGQWLDHRPMTVKGAVTAAAVSTVLSVATLGIGSRLTPLVTRALAPTVATLPVSTGVANAATRVLTNAAVGTALGAGSQVAQNAVTGRPLLEGTKQASVVGGVTGVALVPAQRAMAALAPGSAASAPTESAPVETAPATPPVEGPAATSEPTSLGMAKTIEQMEEVGGTPRPNGLTHLKSEDGYNRMLERGTIRGRSGIYALTDQAVAGSGTVERVLRTGIAPSATAYPVQLPESVTPFFRTVTPVGPYSLVEMGGRDALRAAGRDQRRHGRIHADTRSGLAAARDALRARRGDQHGRRAGDRIRGHGAPERAAAPDPRGATRLLEGAGEGAPQSGRGLNRQAPVSVLRKNSAASSGGVGLM